MIRCHGPGMRHWYSCRSVRDELTAESDSESDDGPAWQRALKLSLNLPMVRGPFDMYGNCTAAKDCSRPALEAVAVPTQDVRTPEPWAP